MGTLDLGGKTVLVTRASWEQLPLIETAKRCGARVVALDETEDASGLAVAHESIVVDSLRDLEACLEEALEYDIDAVVTDECDYSVFIAAYLGERLNLPASSIDSVQTTTNKSQLRKRLAEIVSQPASRTCRTVTEAEEAAESIGLPVVVKPVDNRGALGVSRVTDSENVREAFLSALSRSHSRDVIVEEFVSGTPITVEGYYLNGTHRTLVVGEKDTPLGNLAPNREITYPAALSQTVLRTIRDLNDRIATVIGGFGATHAEYIVTDDGNCQPIEFHNRGGGIHISARVVPELTGFDVSRQLLADATGTVSGQATDDFDVEGVAVLHPLRLAEGTIRELKNVKQVRNHPGVLTFQSYFEPGDELSEPTSPVLSHGLLIVRETSRETARTVIEQVYEMLTPVYEEDSGGVG